MGTQQLFGYPHPSKHLLCSTEERNLDLEQHEGEYIFIVLLFRILSCLNKQKHNKVPVLVCIKVINVVYRPILSDDKQLWYNWMCIIPLNLYIKLNKPYIPASVNVLKGIDHQKRKFCQ